MGRTAATFTTHSFETGLYERNQRAEDKSSNASNVPKYKKTVVNNKSPLPSLRASRPLKRHSTGRMNDDENNLSKCVFTTMVLSGEQTASTKQSVYLKHSIYLYAVIF